LACGPGGGRVAGDLGVVARWGRRRRGGGRGSYQVGTASQRERRKGGALWWKLGWLLGQAGPCGKGEEGRAGPRGEEREEDWKPEGEKGVGQRGPCGEKKGEGKSWPGRLGERREGGDGPGQGVLG
jgi:hypothetical protein